MFKNYFKIAWRKLMKNKTFSFINIAGLTIGMAACLLILQYVSFELSFDQFHKDIKDIYRVYNDRYQNGKLIQHGTITYSAIGKSMNDDFDEVVENVRVLPQGERIVTYGDRRIFEEDAFAVDANFLTMFSFPLLAGNPSTALRDPNTVVLSESLARKVFAYKGNDFSQLVDKSITIGNDSTLFKVTGICSNVPENSHLKFNLLISYQTIISTYRWKQSDYDFTDSDFWHYVRLKPGTDYKKLQEKFPAYSKRHFDGNKVSGSDEKFYLQPLSKAHLYSDFEYEIGKTGSATVVWGLLIIAVFIILIAWVNYINLTTARSLERAKEVGIRKVVGSRRKQLISQFMIESLLVNLFSLVLAFLIVFACQSAFNQLLQHQLSISYLFTKGLSGYTIAIGLLLILLTGIVASGFYPAFVLSSFKPILVLKGNYTGSKRGILLRKALVVGQFGITVGLMIGSVVVFRQLSFMSKKELGFNMEQMMIIRPPVLTEWDSTFISRTNQFKEELKQMSNVKGAATSWSVPGGELGRSFNVRQADSGSAARNTVRHSGVDYDFFKLYQVKLIAGRYFLPSDHNEDFSKLRNMIINKSAVKILGFASPEAALGKSILRGDRSWDIVGVVDDYHQKSLRFPLEPIIYFPAYSTYSDISVRINPTDASTTISAIREKYNKFFPGNLFDYIFLDERFNRQYRDEQLFGKVFGIFSAFAIFIACLGLFGLSLFATMQRTKEIGVRKVLGASVSNILLLLSKDFMRLIIIANVIAFPVAWWIMHNWLQDFAYRTSLSWWIFLLAGALALVVAVVTISLQTIRASIANPVKSLRTE